MAPSCSVSSSFKGSRRDRLIINPSSLRIPQQLTQILEPQSLASVFNRWRQPLRKTSQTCPSRPNRISPRSRLTRDIRPPITHQWQLRRTPSAARTLPAPQPQREVSDWPRSRPRTAARVSRTTWWSIRVEFNSSVSVHRTPSTHQPIKTTRLTRMSVAQLASSTTPRTTRWAASHIKRRRRPQMELMPALILTSS